MVEGSVDLVGVRARVDEDWVRRSDCGLRELLAITNHNL